MSCGCEPKDPRLSDHKFPSSVIEIKNGEQVILFRKVVIPASLGDRETVPPEIGRYRNVLLEYERDGSIFLYSSDGIPTELSTDASELSRRLNVVSDGLAAEILARTNADTSLRTDLSSETDARASADTSISSRIDSVSGIASTAVQPSDINYTLVSDFDVDTNQSTSFLKLNAGKVNISTGVTSTKNVSLPVASSLQAGIMNSATFDAVANNTTAIEALSSGAVAVTGLPASPTQAQMTTAWQTATGQTTLINRASVYDVTNEKVWTYYTNDTTWHAVSNTTQVVIDTFTNSSEGTIKGSTVAGQIFAESDGTGSVNGWDALTAQVAANTANIPTVYDATLTIQNNGTNVATFTANSSTNTTANIVSPVNIGSVLSTPSSVAYVDTANIIDGAVTDAKFAQKAVNKATKTANNITVANDTPAGWAEALGGDGYYWTYYNADNCFANQPNQNGQLETLITGTRIYQRWHTHAWGSEYYRGGNENGWWGSANLSGTFRASYDEKNMFVDSGYIIPHGDTPDLNTLAFVQPGVYIANRNIEVPGYTNCPTQWAFRMEVTHISTTDYYVHAGSAWVNAVRVLTDVLGAVYVQTVQSNGTEPIAWTYGPWHRISGGNNDGQITNANNVLTMANGFSYGAAFAYRDGNMLHLSVSVHKDSGNFGAQEVVATLNTLCCPAYNLNTGCFLGTTEWTANEVGYLFINMNGEILVADATGMHNWAKIDLTFPLKQ